jgi:WD40 repeat protein
VFGCRYGDFIEVDLPEQPQAYERNSYYLAHVPVKRFKFKSIKSSIKRNEQIKELELKKEQKRRLKMKELERIKRESPDEKINEEEFLAESDDEETLKAIHIPDPPNKILWIQYTKDGTFWLSLDGYDAGYVYEYCKESGELLSYTKIPSAENDAIYSFIYRDEYCIFGMSNGQIRINRMSNENWRDLSNYWVLSMHDNFFGSIPALRFSYDHKFLFSIGTDGNLFAYNWNLPVTYVQPIQPTPIPKLVAIVRDIDDPKHLSLEQQKEQENEEQQLKFSADKKDKVLATIAKLRKEFEEIMMK